MNLQSYLLWEEKPLSLLSPQQQIHLKYGAETCQFELGQVI